MAPLIEAIAPYIDRFARYHRFIESVAATDWLPYHTILIDYVEQCGDDLSLLDARMTSFYEDNWGDIRRDMEKRLDLYDIAQETRDTFREALCAHFIGHYRCVCRVLFPQVEREFRMHSFEDRAGPIASDKLLKGLTSRGELADFLPREAYGWILFTRLVHHLYEPVHSANRTKYAEDHVPNRHASIHGLVTYSTHKHSMNMIIMADYVFQILTSTAELPSVQR